VKKHMRREVTPELYRPDDHAAKVAPFEFQFLKGRVAQPETQAYTHKTTGGSSAAAAAMSLDGVDPNLLPRNYKDRTFSYEQIHGHTREEKARRDAARRPDGNRHFQLSPMTRTSLNLTPVKGKDDRSGRRCLAEPAVAVVDRYPKPQSCVALFQQQPPPPLPSRPGTSSSSATASSATRTLADAERAAAAKAAERVEAAEAAKQALTTPLHALAASARLLNQTSLAGTLKRNPLAVSRTDAGHRTPLHWLMLNSQLTLKLLRMYVEFSPAAASSLAICDAHGEHTPVDYFMTAHERIGHTKWRKCLLFLAQHDIAGELMYDADPFYYQTTKGCQGLSAAPLMAVGGRVVSVRCDAPAERQHLQGNPQALHNSARVD